MIKLFLYLSLPTLLIAMPEGFQPLSGDVKPPVTDRGAMTIEAGRQAIVQWEGFSIAGHETVRFIQPDAQSAILNRVVGFSESRLDGLLQANGQVYLINPNGVIIGPGGRIETAAFIGSTFDLLDEDFLKGKDLLFKKGGEGELIQFGKIEACQGDIFLIGSRVVSEGELVASEGRVGIGCGQEILLRPEGRERLFIKVALGEQEGPLLTQTGAIRALSAELKAGGNPYAKAIHASGTIDASQVVLQGGEIFLVANPGGVEWSGTLLADSEQGAGGTLHVLGDEIAVKETARGSASGWTKGGEILIGGDAHGENREILNAKNTTIAKGAMIQANALGNGDGGKVVVWSDGTTFFNGEIQAKGAADGRGGFVETSGKEIGILEGVVNPSSPTHRGTWLIDPTTITVQTAGGGGLPVDCGNPAGAIIVAPASIASAGGDVTLCASGQILVLESIAAPHALTLQSQTNTVVINQSITSPTNISIIAQGINVAASLTATGTVTLQTDQLSSSSSVNCSDLIFNSFTAMHNDDFQPGTFTFNATNSITINCPITTTSATTFGTSSASLIFGANGGLSGSPITFNVGLLDVSALPLQTVSVDIGNGDCTVQNLTLQSGQTLQLLNGNTVSLVNVQGNSSSTPSGTLLVQGVETIPSAIGTVGPLSNVTFQAFPGLGGEIFTSLSGPAPGTNDFVIANQIDLTDPLLIDIIFLNSDDTITFRCDVGSNGSINIPIPLNPNGSTGNVISLYGGSTGTLTLTGGTSGPGMSAINVLSGASYTTQGTFQTGTYTVASIPTSLTGSLTLTATGNIQSLGSMSGTGVSVDMTSSGGSITVGGIQTNGGGSITLQPDNTLTTGSSGNVPINFLTLQGDLTAPGGTISLSNSARTGFPSVATIIGSSGVAVSCATFTMGLNEAFTSLGNLSITATTSATLSDLTAANLLTIDAPTITLNNRSAISLLSPFGTLYSSPNLHWTSYSTPSVTGTQGAGTVTISGVTQVSQSLFTSFLSASGYTLDLDPICLPIIAPPPVTPIETVIATTTLQNLLTPSNSTTPLSRESTQTVNEQGIGEETHTVPYNNSSQGGGLCH